MGRLSFTPATSEQWDEVGNDQLLLLTEGPDRFNALLALIASAERSLKLLFYMFADDRSGERVRDALVAAASRGVKVELMTDRFGCSDVEPDFCTPLTDAGGTFCQFHPSWGRRYLLRNHQKMAIADETVGIVGGANITDQYFGNPANNCWRDLWLAVEGPSVARLADYFDSILEWGLRPKSRIRELRRIIQKHSETSGRLQWQFGAPMRRLSPWAKSMGKEMAQARQIAIIAAYFSPPRGMLKRIAATGRTGKARIITAARSDNNATIAAARFTYKRLLRSGVEVYEYRPCKLHTKLIIADDVVMLGSSNVDFRSLYLNLEVMLRIDDHHFAGRMRSYFEDELKDCVRITPGLHARRASLWRRIKWALSFFLVTTADYTVTRRLNFGAE